MNTIVHTATLRSGAVGFLAGAVIPIMVANLYVIPQHNYAEQRELNWLKRTVSVMNWQVANLDRQSSGKSLLNHDSYRDGLYWAGF